VLGAVSELTLLQAIRAALGDAMDESDRVVLLGQDVGALGGVFRATEGLSARFPGRVFDTPLAEGAIVGASIGLAIGGLVPVAEVQFLGFLHQAFHQVTQQLARYRFRSRGRFHLPVTVRAPYGGGLRMPEFHPDSLEAQLANTPGLKVFAPAFPEDAYTLLRAAVHDPDPVLFLEPQRLYRSVRGPVPLDVSAEASLGVRLRREGDDLLLVSWGPSVHTCQVAANELEQRYGVRSAVLDLRVLSPMDHDGLCEAAALRRRVMVVHEGVRTAGLGAEIVASLQESLAGTISLPILRVTAPDAPYPPGRLEDAFLPCSDTVVETALKMVDWL
jgi:pyruvate dehydrogenase E1 component subunit beta